MFFIYLVLEKILAAYLQVLAVESVAWIPNYYLTTDYAAIDDNPVY